LLNKHFKIGIRADASPDIGIGHIMRCVSIAHGMQESAMEPIFICENENARSIINSEGFRFIRFNKNGETLCSEIPELISIIQREGIDTILVDSYNASDKYLLELMNCIPTVYIDGLYRCSAEISGVINYNSAAKESEYKKRFAGKKTALMVGLDYVPIRKQFLLSEPRKINEEVKNILVTTGATDNYGFVKSLCGFWLKKKFYPSIKKHIVIGGMYKQKESVINMLDKDNSFIIHEGISDLSALMKKTDIAISAAGTTVYELLAMGIPSVIMSFADIQNTAQELIPAISWAGDIRDDLDSDELSADAVARVSLLVKELIESRSIRLNMSKQAFKCVDGKGIYRIAKIIRKIAETAETENERMRVNN